MRRRGTGGGIQGGQGGGQQAPPWRYIPDFLFVFCNSSRLQKNYLLLFVFRALISWDIDICISCLSCFVQGVSSHGSGLGKLNSPGKHYDSLNSAVCNFHIFCLFLIQKCSRCKMIFSIFPPNFTVNRSLLWFRLKIDTLLW